MLRNGYPVKHDKKQSILKEEVFALFPSLKRVLLFSFFTNVLVLAPSGYMLEVYDRVVNSRNHTTLLMLTVLVVFLYLLLETLEWVRGQVMYEAGSTVDDSLRDRVFHAMTAARLSNVTQAASLRPLNDLRTLRDFLSSHALQSIIDAPFALLVLVILFFMDPLLALFAAFGALVQFAIGIANERRTREPLEAANTNSFRTQLYAGGLVRNAQVIESMGMLGNIHKRWLARHEEFIEQQAIASDHAGSNAALSKMAQSLVGSLMLGLGCWLALKGELRGSQMIVASILVGRVLSPLVQIIGSWRIVEGAREAFVRLDELLAAFPEPQPAMPLPAPKGALNVEAVVAGPPRSDLQILKGISFALPAGGSLAVVGPSASGKTTLARLLVGVWPAVHGKVRLDGCDVHAWNKEELGPSVGYLPQNVELFDGTVAENISRFGDVDQEKVEAACRLVGVEQFVQALPKGYDTAVGEEGAFLSGGERQRIALARAVYGLPRFVVLDEPNSSLDEAGDSALLHTIRFLKSQGTTVVVMTHRTNILSVMDSMLVLLEGRVRSFGPTREVLASLQQKQAQPAAPTNGSQPDKPAGGA